MSCLFNSINYFIKADNGEDVRQCICNYLDNNYPVMENMETRSVLISEDPSGNYVNHMRNSCTMGGAIEIQAACNIWKLKIIVINNRGDSSDKKFIEFVPIINKGKILRTIHLSWTGNHYDPVIVQDNNNV